MEDSGEGNVNKIPTLIEKPPFALEEITTKGVGSISTTAPKEQTTTHGEQILKIDKVEYNGHHDINPSTRGVTSNKIMQLHVNIRLSSQYFPDVIKSSFVNVYVYDKEGNEVATYLRKKTTSQGELTDITIPVEYSTTADADWFVRVIKIEKSDGTHLAGLYRQRTLYINPFESGDKALYTTNDPNPTLPRIDQIPPRIKIKNEVVQIHPLSFNSDKTTIDRKMNLFLTTQYRLVFSLELERVIGDKVNKRPINYGNFRLHWDIYKAKNSIDSYSSDDLSNFEFLASAEKKITVASSDPINEKMAINIDIKELEHLFSLRTMTVLTITPLDDSNFPGTSFQFPFNTREIGDTKSLYVTRLDSYRPPPSKVNPLLPSLDVVPAIDELNIAQEEEEKIISPYLEHLTSNFNPSNVNYIRGGFHGKDFQEFAREKIENTALDIMSCNQIYIDSGMGQCIKKSLNALCRIAYDPIAFTDKPFSWAKPIYPNMDHKEFETYRINCEDDPEKHFLIDEFDYNKLAYKKFGSDVGEMINHNYRKKDRILTKVCLLLYPYSEGENLLNCIRNPRQFITIYPIKHVLKIVGWPELVGYKFRKIRMGRSQREGADQRLVRSVNYKKSYNFYETLSHSIDSAFTPVALIPFIPSISLGVSDSQEIEIATRNLTSRADLDLHFRYLSKEKINMTIIAHRFRFDAVSTPCFTVIGRIPWEKNSNKAVHICNEQLIGEVEESWITTTPFNQLEMFSNSPAALQYDHPGNKHFYVFRGSINLANYWIREYDRLVEPSSKTGSPFNRNGKTNTNSIDYKGKLFNTEEHSFFPGVIVTTHWKEGPESED